MASTPTRYIGPVTFEGDVVVSGGFSATGIPTLNGATLTINADAVAATDQDPALAMKGGSGSTNLEVHTLGQDSSTGKAFFKRQSGAAGTTEASPALHIGAIATTAAVNSTLVLEAGASSTNKPASLVNTGSTGVLAITGTTGVTLSDSVATLSLNAGALTENTLASVDLSPSGSVGIAAGTTAQISGTTVSLNGSTAVSAIVPDNVANAFRVLEGANEYVKVTTTDASEAIALGNATTNPAITTLGTGAVTFGGAVTAQQGITASAGKPGAIGYFRYKGGTSRGGTNTAIIRYATAIDSSGNGVITFTDDAANGSYITATVNCEVSVGASHAGNNSTFVIKKNTALNNTLDGNTDLDWVANAYSAGSVNANCAGHCYMAAGDVLWVASTAAPSASAISNMLTIRATAV